MLFKLVVNTEMGWTRAKGKPNRIIRAEFHEENCPKIFNLLKEKLVIGWLCRDCNIRKVTQKMIKMPMIQLKDFCFFSSNVFIKIIATKRMENPGLVSTTADIGIRDRTIFEDSIRSIDREIINNMKTSLYKLFANHRPIGELMYIA